MDSGNGADSGGAHRKLQTLAERFSSFERQVEADLRARKHTEESTIDALKSSLVRLEQTMEAESKRRTESQRAQRMTVETQLQSAQDKLETSFLERFDQLHSTIDALADRMGVVEIDFGQSRERYIRDMEDRSVQVNKDVGNLSLDFDAELHARREREGALMNKIATLEANTIEKFEGERLICDQKYNQLFEDFDASKKVREDAHTRFEDAAKAKLASVKAGIEAETKAREQADDDIVTALNHYTAGLQDALGMVSQERLTAATHILDQTGNTQSFA